MATTAVFKTVVNAVYVYEGESQELAIRAWDSESVHRAGLHGGVMVQEFHGELMVRDGWILHVNEDGHVYLNPRV
jgi:hypothetical protein